ncbi:ATP-binding protein [Streptomyces polygonati]|uniref:ATP-binding protein n=1 Tax=Streptomyces polygonati TaxID=1617087 RepID=A0ABV8HN74_9ACTN
MRETSEDGRGVADTATRPAMAPSPVRRTTEPPLYRPPERLWPATPRGVHRARHALTARLTDWRLPELDDPAGLVLGELLANALKHGSLPGRSIGTRFTRLPTAVRLEVHDARGESHPTPTPATDSDEHGRGLTIIDAITAGHWGTTTHPGPGKIVWALCHFPPSRLY